MKKEGISSVAIRNVLRDYWQQYRKSPFAATSAFLLPAIGNIFVSFIPPLAVAHIVNVFVSNRSIPSGELYVYVLIFGGFWILGEAFWRVGLHLLIKLEAKGLADLGTISFKRLVVRDYDFYINNFVGSLTKRATAFSRGFETFTDTLSFNIFTNVLPIIFAVIVLWRYSPWIPLVLLVCITIALAVGLPIIRSRSRLVAERHEAGSKVSGRLSDAITNILAIKSFAKEEVEEGAFTEFVSDYAAKYKKAADYQNLRFEAVMSPIYVGTNVLGLLAAIFFTQYLGLQAGAMVVVFSYYSQISRVFWEINRVYRNFESSISEAAEFTEMFIKAPLVQDAPQAKDLSGDQSAIVFSDVGFRYDVTDTQELFLNNFNLDIKPNQKVGLVGPSGGGKTTITKLLLRFTDIQQGSITIGGQDIKTATQASLRRAIAYVPQESLLFHRSLFENIAYGHENATKEDVRRAAKLARADEFIERLPHGYETLVGERGIKLSGGQRQRVAIARAILKQSPILVLDEATSSLDSESEKYIQEGLKELMKGKTALVIAHRLSTIKHLDRIIVLDHGKIVQDGTHDELIKRDGLYAKLWSHQSGEFLEDTVVV